MCEIVRRTMFVLNDNVKYNCRVSFLFSSKRASLGWPVLEVIFMSLL